MGLKDESEASCRAQCADLRGSAVGFLRLRRELLQAALKMYSSRAVLPRQALQGIKRTRQTERERETERECKKLLPALQYCRCNAWHLPGRGRPGYCRTGDGQQQVARCKTLLRNFDV